MELSGNRGERNSTRSTNEFEWKKGRGTDHSQRKVQGKQPFPSFASFFVKNGRGDLIIVTCCGKGAQKGEKRQEHYISFILGHRAKIPHPKKKKKKRRRLLFGSNFEGYSLSW